MKVLFFIFSLLVLAVQGSFVVAFYEGIPSCDKNVTLTETFFEYNQCEYTTQNISGVASLIIKDGDNTQVDIAFYSDPKCAVEVGQVVRMTLNKCTVAPYNSTIFLNIAEPTIVNISTATGLQTTTTSSSSSTSTSSSSCLLTSPYLAVWAIILCILAFFKL